jgi:hypothetical protein
VDAGIGAAGEGDPRALAGELAEGRLQLSLDAGSVFLNLGATEAAPIVL